MLELESCHLATIIIIIGSGKNHQWILKLGENLKKNNIYMVSMYIPTKLLTTNKNSNFTMEKPGRHHLNQMIKVSITSNGTILSHEHPDVMH